MAGMKLIPRQPDEVPYFVPTVWERDERKGSGWKPMKTVPVPKSYFVRFNDVDASSPRNGLVVGDYAEQLGGVMTQHWNGKAWKSALAPVPRKTTQASFYGVDTLAPDNAWGVGVAQIPIRDGSREVGLLQHWDGTRWKAQKLPDIGEGGKVYWSLWDVTAPAADDVWAVGTAIRVGGGGAKPLLLHYDGTRWSRVAAPDLGAAGGSLTSVAAGPRGQVWAVGDAAAAGRGRQGLALRYDGRKWVKVPLPKGTKPLNSVANSQGDPVVVELKTEETSAVLRHSGGKWVSMNLPADGATPYAAWAVSASGRTIDVVGNHPATGSQEVGPGSVLTARR
ncbi:hypothetical protein ACZ90_40295 [Streptomyces albus subsp. albus]|nr:hypothetical protein ACZ90_40295 [Streptomyces albus subsp. albus]